MSSEKSGGRGAAAYLCGVEQSECSGVPAVFNSGIKGRKTHASRREAFQCKCRSLVKAGYERIGQKEFRLPGGGILLLSRAGQFGTRVRAGKGEALTPISGGGLVVSS